jgi:hypothetical protein
MTPPGQSDSKPLTYREAERLLQAQWILDYPYDYTDREIRRAREIQSAHGGNDRSQR